MSGYNRSCSRADSSILLATQCAAALSMMPASAAKLLGAGGYSRVVQRICHLGFSFGWNFMGETIGEARSSCQRAYPCRIDICPLLACLLHPVSRERNPSLERSLLPHHVICQCSD